MRRIAAVLVALTPLIVVRLMHVDSATMRVSMHTARLDSGIERAELGPTVLGAAVLAYDPPAPVTGIASRERDRAPLLRVEIGEWQPPGTSEPLPTETITSTATLPPTATEPTPVPTSAPTNVTLRGWVFSAAGGPDAPVAHARIRVPPCHTPHQPFEATSHEDGSYELVLPAPYFLPGCTVWIDVGAPCFAAHSESHLWDDLAANPERSFTLEPIEGCVGAGPVYLPYTARLTPAISGAAVERWSAPRRSDSARLESTRGR